LVAKEIAVVGDLEAAKHEAPGYPSTAGAQECLFQGEDFWLVEEKLDGANCGAWIGQGGEIRIRDRTRVLRKGVKSEGWGKRQFEPLWERAHGAAKAIRALEKEAGERVALYGEWMLVEHGCSYTAVAEPWRPFALWSIEGRRFLDPMLARRLLTGHGFAPPILLGSWSKESGWEAARGFAYGESELGGAREGAVFKRGDGRWLEGCSKIVREGFEQGSRWSSESPIFHRRR
jgi:hypothetical protein